MILLCFQVNINLVLVEQTIANKYQSFTKFKIWCLWRGTPKISRFTGMEGNIANWTNLVGGTRFGSDPYLEYLLFWIMASFKSQMINFLLARGTCISLIFAQLSWGILLMWDWCQNMGASKKKGKRSCWYLYLICRRK